MLKPSFYKGGLIYIQYQCNRRSLLGSGYGCTRVLMTCVDVTASLLFEQGIPMDDISVMKDVYAQVAKLLGKTTNAISRNAERMANLCWEMSFP